MFCTYCGAQVSEGANFCMSCGQRLPQAQPAQAAPAAPPQQQPQSQAAAGACAGLPGGVFYDDAGDLHWMYIDHSGEEIGDDTVYEFRYGLSADCVNEYNAVSIDRLDDGHMERDVVSLAGAEEVLMDAVSLLSRDRQIDSIARNRSWQLEFERKAVPQIERSYRYDKVKAIIPNKPDDRIVLKLGGLSKAHLCVSAAQHDFILDELTRRCPQATVERR